MEGQVTQGVHDLGNINVVGTPDAARVTGGTDPDRLRTKDLLTVAILNMAKDPVGKKIHGVGDRTPRRALLALITGLKVFTAGLDDLR
jgi:hypothetical protein